MKTIAQMVVYLVLITCNMCSGMTMTDLNLANNCGPSCLVLYLRLNNIDATIPEISVLAKKDIHGASIGGLKKAAEAKGIYAMGIECKSIRALKSLPFPAITMMNYATDRGSYKHYLLVLSINGDKVKVVDPPHMPYIVSLKQFEKSFTGNMLLLSKEPIVLPERGGNWIPILGGLVFITATILSVINKKKIRGNRDGN